MRIGSKTAKTGIVFVIMAVTAFGLYYYLVNKAKISSPQTETSAVQDVLLKNLETDYPATVREVLKYYNEIMSCYYNEDCTQEEIEALADKAMELYDTELADYQDRVQYIANLKTEIERYQKDEIVLSNSSPASSTDVEYYVRDGRDCAKIRCVYTLRKGTNLSTLKEVYIMREDEDGHWKILGWDLADEKEGQIEAVK